VSIGQPISHRIDHLLSGANAPVTIKIRGGDLSVLRGLAARAESAVRGISGVVQVQNERPSLVPGVTVRLKRNAAALYGFTSAAVTEAVHSVLNGQVLARAASARQAQDVVLWSAQELRERPEALGDMPLVSPSGAVVRLADVAELIDTQGPAEIRHEGGIRQVTVACNIMGRDLGGAVEEIQRAVDQALQPALPPGYTVAYSGQYENRRRAAQLLWPLSLLALFAASLLLYSHFRALAPVVQILLNIPFAFIGGVAALAVAHEPLSLASMIGFITLAGIASRNGVLMISHFIHLIQREGQRFDRETIVRGSQERVAPVLMTALTTGLALLPLVFSKGEPGKEMLYPIALVVIGGLISTTLLDFILTPALFLRFGKGAVFNPQINAD
jgi:Cu/Ag efflux pump CusA